MHRTLRDDQPVRRGDDPCAGSSLAGRRNAVRSLRWFVVALVVLSAAALMACAGPPKRAFDAVDAPTLVPPPAATLVSPPAAAAAEVPPASHVPWGRVGPGWTLATWSPTPGGVEQAPSAAPVTLYLLDPAGARYPITTLPALPPTRTNPDNTAFLADWSGDGRRALIGYFDFDAAQTILTDVDLRSGAQRTFRAASEGRDVYSRPTGQTILTSRFDSDKQASTLERVDLSGAKQLSFPNDFGAAGKYNGAFLQTPDGTQLVLGTDDAMVVVGNDGRIVRQLAPPGPLTNCSPIRWWAAKVILAKCDHGRQHPGTYPDYSSQLWKIPLTGQAATALTAVNTDREDSGFGGDLGDEGAWQLPSGTFLQSDGGCSSGFLSRLTPDKHTTPVNVPGVNKQDSVFVIGTSGDKLVLKATMACGPGVSLLTYDPATNTPTVLLGPPVNGGGVQSAHIHPDP
jgi:hypothetical protein